MIDNETETMPSIEQFTHKDGAKLCSDEVLFSILSDGSWLYLNSPLPTKFARMFSHILHCIDTEYFLITPVEKVKVSVETWPLLMVDVDKTEQGFCFKSNLDTDFNVIQSDIELEQQGIFVSLPRGLTAILNRACYYRYINEHVDFD
jgi:hypothetical protein